MKERGAINPESPERWVDWVDNNAAFTCPCPTCRKVFLVSSFLHPSGRACPACEKSKGFVRGSPGAGGEAFIIWDREKAQEGASIINPVDVVFFCYSASLRIAGTGMDQDEITRSLGVEPTHKHRKGEKPGPSGPGFPDDMWLYTTPLDENEPLERHIDNLWTTIQPHADYILDLKKRFKVDIFLGYRSNSGTAGFEIPYQSLEMFSKLQVRFGLSIIVM